MSPLIPRRDKERELPVEPNPNGSRVFRVTDRTIDERSRLILAPDAESATADDASAIAALSRRVMHEVTECIEFVPGDDVYRVPPREVA